MGRLSNGKKFKRPFTLEPLSIVTLAGLTPPNVELQFFDDRIEDIDYDQPTDLVGISVETFTALRAYQIARHYRMRGIPVVLGGFHPTLLPDEGLRYADSVVIGQAEDLWTKVLLDANKGKLKKRYSSNAVSQITRTRIDRKMLKGKKYLPVTLVEFGRGCPYHCEFCDIPIFYKGRHDVRPVDEVVSEIIASGRKNVLVVDDNISARPYILLEFSKAVKPLNIRWASQAGITLAMHDDVLDAVAESGCVGFLIGFESIDKRNLKLIDKKTNFTIPYKKAIKKFHDRGIRIYGSFIVGYDFDTPKIIDRTVEFAIKNKIFIVNFNPLFPIPKTPLYNRMIKEGRLRNKKWWLDSNFRYGDFPFNVHSMSGDDLTKKCEEVKETFYSISSIIKRGVGSKTNFGNPLSALIYILINLRTRSELRGKAQLYLGMDE